MSAWPGLLVRVRPHRRTLALAAALALLGAAGGLAQPLAARELIESLGEDRSVLTPTEVQMGPGGGPPALHRHAAEDLYRIDRGQLTIFLEDSHGDVQRIVAELGAVVHIPGGRAHTIRDESQADASAYVVFAPGTEMEQFFRAADELAGVGAPQIEDILALAQRHGIEIAAQAVRSPLARMA